MVNKKILEIIKKDIKGMDTARKIEYFNGLKTALHKLSPMKNEPVDCVLWEKSENVEANDYNPNNVAPPEMELLRISINNDGYTQPVVTFSENGKRVVVDGFHRSRVAKECKDIKERVHGYIPVTTIRDSQKDRNNRIASTIRHNRARGKHKVDSMSEIVLELKRRNWSYKKIGKELGMDQDEVLRLTQIGGIADMFSDDEFSQAWEVGETENINIDYEAID